MSDDTASPSQSVTTPRLAGRTAVVTGASRGIGLGIAERLVREGARVVITGRHQESLDQAVSTLGGSDVALAVAGKSDDIDHQSKTIAAAIERFGTVDLLVNNAATNPVFGPLIDVDLDAARKIFEVNALAALSWTQQVHRAWMGEHGGSIVNISSVAGERPSPGIGFYGASKAMLARLTTELAVELGPEIRINAVAPAVVKTKFAASLYEGRESEVASVYPMKRLGVPQDIAGAVAFLLSDDAGWITGRVLVIDGGVTLTGGA